MAVPQRLYIYRGDTTKGHSLGAPHTHCQPKGQWSTMIHYGEALPS